MKKKVSVIIPYYKKLTFIKKTLNSVLQQSYQNFEILLIYDDDDKNDLQKIKKEIVKSKKKSKFTSIKKMLEQVNQEIKV